MTLLRFLAAAGALVAIASACGSSTDPPTSDGAAGGGSAGATGSAGTTGSGGTTGTAGTTGSAGTPGGGGTGAQPLGAACVNSGMCSQADGQAVCCLQISTCVLATQCPTGTTYISCATQPCAQGGWVCCNAGGMQFCTKQSACPN